MIDVRRVAVWLVGIWGGLGLLPAAGCAGDGPVGIDDIQLGRVRQGRCVNVEGVVVTGVGATGFYAQEPQVEGTEQAWEGVWVELGDVAPGVAESDLVDIWGCVDERNEMTVLDASGRGDAVRLVGPGVPVIPSFVWARDLMSQATAEPWEGVLVDTSAVFVVAVDVAAGQFEIADGALPDGPTLIVDDKLYPWYDDFLVQEGQGFTAIDGLLDQDGERYLLQPRRLSDFPDSEN